MIREDDAHIIEALQNGDEDAFMDLVEMYQSSMVRVATMIVRDEAIAEEVVQETWIAVLKGLSNFEGRSSLKTWIFTILMNRAKTYARREGRYTALSSDQDDGDDFEPAVSPDRFLPSDSPHFARHWIVAPRSWDSFPEERLLSEEVHDQIHSAIGDLPAQQREVITLRDVQGMSSDEVCNVLSISETNQRVLLHRARSRVRRALERYFGE